MNKLVTVIVNVYNGEKYIKRCLDSIVNQTYKNLDILIVNDGSTDKTKSICESYKDKRIRIINQKNMGLPKSRNVGIENSKGDYLYFVDADDYLELDIIEYLYNLIKKYNVELSTCRPIDVYDEKINVKNKKEKVDVLTSKDMLKKLLLTIDRAGTIWNKLIKKELFNNIRFEDRRIEDVAVTYKVIMATDKIAYSNQIKYYYYRHPDSIMGVKAEDYSIDMYKAGLDRYDYIHKVYPKFLENDLCMPTLIMVFYFRDTQDTLQKFLKEQKALELYKKGFSLKLIFTQLSFKNKIKMILFRINPNLCKALVKKHIERKIRSK